MGPYVLHLKHVLKPNLHLSHGTRRRDPPECRGRVHVNRRNIVVRMVEEIERLETELKAVALPDPRVFCRREIPLLWIRRGRCRPCQKTFTRAARLVAAVRPLQPPLPPKSLGVATPSQCQLGAIRSPRRQPVAIARSVYRATVGCTLAASGNPAGGAALADHRLESLDSTHHPYLGLDRDPPYSALGGKLSVSWQALDALKQLPDSWFFGRGGIGAWPNQRRACAVRIPRPSTLEDQ